MNKTFKLLLSTGIYPPDIGGPATYAKLLKDELPRRGIEVEILSFGEVRSLPKIIRHSAFFLKAFTRLRKNDIVLAQDTVSVGLPTVLAAKLLRKKIIIRVPGDYAWEQSVQRFGVKEGIDDFQAKRYGFKVELLRFVQKFVVREADTIITPSHYFNKLVSGWVGEGERVNTIYNGIDLKDGQLAVAEEFLSPTLVSAGRLVSWKGFACLIELMTELPEYNLIIVGDGPERQNLEQKIDQLELRDRVKISGSLPKLQMLGLMKGAKVFVLNTHFESFSFQIVEAMNVGVPVVATNIGNLSEIVDDGQSGFLVKPDDKEAIKAQILLLQNEELRSRIIETAKQKVQNFSIENTLAKLAKLFNEVPTKR